MNTLLIFFALPIAVIIISIALQKVLKCPALVAAIIFAIFLIVTFIVNNLNLLIAAIVYAIISFITAFITCVIGRLLNRIGRENSCCQRSGNRCGCDSNDTSNVLTINSGSQNDENNGRCNQNNNGCCYQITNADGLSARINIVPNPTNQNNNGCCRRR